MTEKERKFYERFHIHFHEDDVLWNNEVKANLFLSFILNVLMFVMGISWVLAYWGLFDVPMQQMNLVLAVNIPMLALGSFLTIRFKGAKHWLKFLLCAITLCTATAMASVLNIFVSFILLVPVLLSVRYYSGAMTRMMSVLSVFGMAIAEFLYAHNGLLNLNLVEVSDKTLQVAEGGLRAAVINAGFDKQMYLVNLFRGSFAPRLLLFLVIALICVELATRARENIEDQEAVTKKAESISTELKLATSIQYAVLPKRFPPFLGGHEVDIAASMKPAKEVGGDFYDFYVIDKDHMGIVIADVSGKGIPASLFMMVSKALIKTGLCSHKSPGEVAASVNDQLMEGNDAEMFLTAWIGVLDLSNGHLVSIDAGHEYPAVRHADGVFELMKDKKSFVLAGMDGMTYKENECDLQPGDVLFLYTDGIPEATDANNNMFGIERMLETLNSCEKDDPQSVMTKMQDSVHTFVGANDQFDDMTILCVRYNGDSKQ